MINISSCSSNILTSFSPELTSEEKAPSAAVIIGGGPIGLWTAIQLRLLSNQKITVIEKYNH